jgi:hypothetical protein
MQLPLWPVSDVRPDRVYDNIVERHSWSATPGSRTTGRNTFLARRPTQEGDR